MAATSRAGVHPSSGRPCRAYIQRPAPAGSSTSFGGPRAEGRGVPAPVMMFSAAPTGRRPCSGPRETAR
jgi:hypothetical protein